MDAPEATEQDDRTVRDRTIGKTHEIWKRLRSLIIDNYHLPRAENTETHENAFWEGHALVGSREEVYAENGTWNFAAETTRDRAQTGSTHRPSRAENRAGPGPEDAPRDNERSDREGEAKGWH